jgi:hypothetical protein
MPDQRLLPCLCCRQLTTLGARQLSSHIAVPTRWPMPAVSAIASAPQNVTRCVGLKTPAPPALAPMAPSSARNASDAKETVVTSIDAGDTMTMGSGIAAPAAKVAADVKAAWIGRAVVISEIPSSSRAWA